MSPGAFPARRENAGSGLQRVPRATGPNRGFAEGGYEDICRGGSFKRGRRTFDVFHLEFDDERSGSVFEPLRASCRMTRVAVLGLGIHQNGQTV